MDASTDSSLPTDVDFDAGEALSAAFNETLATQSPVALGEVMADAVLGPEVAEPVAVGAHEPIAGESGTSPLPGSAAAGGSPGDGGAASFDWSELSKPELLWHANDLLDRFDALQGGERDVAKREMASLRDRLAEVQRRTDEHFERVFTDERYFASIARLPAVRLAAEVSSSPRDVPLVLANKAVIADAIGVHPSELEDTYEPLRDGFAQARFGISGGVTNREFFDFVSKDLRAQREWRPDQPPQFGAIGKWDWEHRYIDNGLVIGAGAPPQGQQPNGAGLPATGPAVPPSVPAAPPERTEEEQLAVVKELVSLYLGNAEDQAADDALSARARERIELEDERLKEVSPAGLAGNSGFPGLDFPGPMGLGAGQSYAARELAKRDQEPDLPAVKKRAEELREDDRKLRFAGNAGYAVLHDGEVAINPAAFQPDGLRPEGLDSWERQVDRAQADGALEPAHAERMKRHLGPQVELLRGNMVAEALINDAFKKWLEENEPDFYNRMTSGGDNLEPQTEADRAALQAKVGEFFKADPGTADIIGDKVMRFAMATVPDFAQNVSTLTGLAANAGGQASNPVGDALQDFGSGIEAMRAQMQDPRMRNSIAGEVAEGLGETAQMMLPAGAVGRGARLLRMSARGVRMARAGTVAGAGAMQNASSIYREARRMGLSEKEALLPATLGGVVGLSEVMPVTKWVRRLGLPVRAKVGRIVFRMVHEAAENAAQGTAQGLSNNAIAKAIYDEHRELLEGLAGEAGLGGGTGAIMSLLVSTVAGVRAKAQGAGAPAGTGGEIPGRMPGESPSELPVIGSRVDEGAAKGSGPSSQSPQEIGAIAGGELPKPGDGEPLAEPAVVGAKPDDVVPKSGEPRSKTPAESDYAVVEKPEDAPRELKGAESKGPDSSTSGVNPDLPDDVNHDQSGIQILERDEKNPNIVIASFKVARGEAQITAEIIWDGDTLILHGTHIAGDGTLREALEAAKQFGRQHGAKKVIIEGGERTTGANPYPGRLPRPITVKTGL
jgi:hypothetical protein